MAKLFNQDDIKKIEIDNLTDEAISTSLIEGEIFVIQRYTKNQNLGYSILSSIYFRRSPGGETSSLSAKTSLLKNTLPIQLEEDWITRADECLCWATSFHGAKKYYCNKALIEYRMHDKNAYARKNFSENYLYQFQRLTADDRLFQYLHNKKVLNKKSFLEQHSALRLIQLATQEFNSIEIKTLKNFKLYSRIILLTRLSTIKKMSKVFKLFFTIFTF